MLTVPDVNVLANSLRAAIRQGDTELQSQGIERKFLQAIVAKGAADLSTWINTREPNGGVLSQPLNDLLPDLEKGNHVGTTMRAIEEEALSQARTSVTTAVLTLTIPAWIGSAMTAILGFTASTYGAGFSFGGSILPGLLASIGSVGFIAAFALRAANAVGPAVGAGMGTMFDAVTSVGQRAERIFRDSTSKAFAAYSIPSSTVNPATISIRLRNVYIKGPIYSSFGILAICILIFLIGAYQGYDQYQNCMTFADSLEEMGRCRSGRSG